jgi:hypothetical protein
MRQGRSLNTENPLPGCPVSLDLLVVSLDFLLCLGTGRAA